ncbi:MAG: pseudouridine synthase, partial [Mucinivorans sp.]
APESSNNSRSERPSRPARSFDRSSDRSDRPARGGSSDRPARSFDRSSSHSDNRPDRAARPARSFDRSSDRPARGGSSDRPARSFDRSSSHSDNRPDRAARPARSFDRSSDRQDRPARSSDRPQLTQRVERTERPRRSNESYSPRVDKPKKTLMPQTAALPSSIRLNRFIAQSGICSRREADQLIQNGEIEVNKEIITELGTKVNSLTDVVTYDGKVLSGQKLVYILMNKPKGYVTTTEDPHADKTVIDIIKNQVRERVYPVGRLDKNTTGVLLLTNDGDLTRELTHPSFEKRKIYHVFVDRAVEAEHIEAMASGIELEDGPIAADQISYVDGNRKEVGVEIHSGRNRIVRRMFEHFDYKVVKLDRVYFAGFTKDGLRRGFWRPLTAREVATLKGGNFN